MLGSHGCVRQMSRPQLADQCAGDATSDRPQAGNSVRRHALRAGDRGRCLAPGVRSGGATLAVSAVLMAPARCCWRLGRAASLLCRPEWDLEWLVTLPLPLSTAAGEPADRAGRDQLDGIHCAGARSCRCSPGRAATAGRRRCSGFGIDGGAAVRRGDRADPCSTPGCASRCRRRACATCTPWSRRQLPVLPLLSPCPWAMPDNALRVRLGSALPAWARLAAARPRGARARQRRRGRGCAWSGAHGREIVADRARDRVRAAAAPVAQRRRVGGARAKRLLRRPAAERPRAACADARPGRCCRRVPRRELRLLGARPHLHGADPARCRCHGRRAGLLNASQHLCRRGRRTRQTWRRSRSALAAYTLMFSAFQTLNAEGQALWILYCVPQSLEFDPAAEGRAVGGGGDGLSAAHVRESRSRWPGRVSLAVPRLGRDRPHRRADLRRDRDRARRVRLRPARPGGAAAGAADLPLSLHDAGLALRLRDLRRHVSGSAPP